MTINRVQSRTDVAPSRSSSALPVLAERWVAPVGRDPALLYLEGLAPSGRRALRVGLERIARWASGGVLGWQEFHGTASGTSTPPGSWPGYGKAAGRRR